MINIRAYKVFFLDGHYAFEIKSKDDRGSVGCGSIESLAKNVKHQVDEYLEKTNNIFDQASVDLFPLHDIECPSDLQPRFCVALSFEEKQEFWKYFNQTS